MPRVPSSAVCFDMDGVLVDSEYYWARREQRDIFPTTVEGDVDPTEVAGMNVVDLYDYLECKYGTRVQKSEFVSRYDAAAKEVYREQVTLLSDASTLITTIRTDRPVALVSSSPDRWIDHVIDRFDLSFDAVVSANHVDRGKPAPDVYERAATLLDVAPEDCVAVEDSTHGVKAATAAGMTTIGFSRSGDSPEADHTVPDVVKLRTALTAAGPPHR